MAISRLPGILGFITFRAPPSRAQQATSGQPHPEQAQPQPRASPTDYNLLISSGFLCDPDQYRDRTAVAGAAQGESIEITGAGAIRRSAIEV